MSGPLRVLAIPDGQTKDHAGREIGDDWQLADFGSGEDGTRIYVTTDRIRCSEMCDLDGIGPAELAQFLVDAYNAEHERRLQLPLPGIFSIERARELLADEGEGDEP